MNGHSRLRAADLLLVAGSFDGFNHIQHSLQRAKIRNRLHHVGDAAEARAYLRRDGPYLHAPTPGLILLDEGLQTDSVIALITELKTDPQFAGIAVIACAGSESEYDVIDNCIYEVDGRIQKPFNLGEFIQVLLSVDPLSFLLLRSEPTS